MKLSCCIWGLDEGTGLLRYWRRFRGQRLDLSQSLRQLAELGFHYADITPSMLRSKETQSSLGEYSLTVNCLSACHEAPKGGTLDSDEPSRINPMTHHLEDGIAHAASLGATFSYFVPGPLVDENTLQRHAQSYEKLAELGADHGMKIGIEHFPGTALPTVKATLDFIRDIGHPNLYLLFDLGHAQISKEDPADVLPLAGDRLGYVHLDDNDGERDLHLPLTEGIQTEASLAQFFTVLKDVGYDGALSLEMMPKLPDPLDAIRRGKALVEQFVDFDA